MKSTTQSIPEILIYEMVAGQPIYYRGYKKYLKGTRQLEELMGSSLLQSLIISRLVFLLQLKIDKDYEVLTNELGIQFGKNSWRAADIAIIKATDMEAYGIDNKYLKFAPEVVIEIDTKAELKEIKNPLGYYHEKTDQFLKFGVTKVIWIFTESKKVMVAEKNKSWQTSDWKDTVEIINGIDVKIKDLIKKRK